MIWLASSRVGASTSPRTVRRLGAGFAFQHLGHQRDTEGGGFAGAGLCQPHHVAAIHPVGDRLFLDRGRIGHTHVGQGFDQTARQAHHFKIAHRFVVFPRDAGQSPFPP